MNTITFKYKHQHTDEIWNVVIDKDTLIKDWENDAEYCPPNDTKLMSVITDNKELIGTCLPKKTDFERFIKYLITHDNLIEHIKKKLTITELKGAFKKDGWKFSYKEKAKKHDSTDIFVFKKSIGTKSSTIWLTFNSFRDVKTYFYDTELHDSKDDRYDSFNNCGENFVSLQNVLNDINENITNF